MSNNTLEQEAISDIINALNWRYCYVATFSVYVYDQCITFDRQAAFYWHRKLSIPTVLMVLLHLSTLVSFACNIAGASTVVSCESGYRLNNAYNGADIVFDFVNIVVATLRVYAVTGRDWRVSAVTFTLYLPLFTSLIYWSCTLILQMLGNSNCASVLLNPTVYYRFSVAGLVTRVLGELMVLLVTWRGTHSMKKMASNMNINVSLAHLLLRDGTVYFGAQLLLESFNVAGAFVSSLQGLSGLTTAITAVLLIHFFLNLHQVVTAQDGPSTDSHHLSNISFTQGLDSLGGSLQLDDGFVGSSNDGESDQEDMIHDNSEREDQCSRGDMERTDVMMGPNIEGHCQEDPWAIT